MLMNASGSRGDAVQRTILTDELAGLAALVGTGEARLVAGMVASSYAVWDGRNADGGGLAEMAAADAVALAAVVPGESLVVWANGQEGWRLWATGRPDAARTFARAAVACARLRSNPADLAVALFLAAHVPLWRGDLDEATALVDEGQRLAGEQGLGLWFPGLGGVAGAIHAARGEAAAAVRELELALAEFHRLGVLMHTPTMLAGLGGAWLQLGKPSKGLAAVDEGIERGRSTRSRWYEPELWTLRGRLLAAQGTSSDAVASAFEQALEVARSHGALAFELRAATAWADWLASRGRGGEACATLAACHARFREGADTADLRQASEVLVRLGT
jgi:hypothetical protein